MKKLIVISTSVLLCVSLIVSVYFLYGFGSSKSNVTVVNTPAQKAATVPDQFAVKRVDIKRPSGKNLALNQKVTTDGITDVYTPERAVDGKTAETSYWEGKPDMPNTFTVTLDQPQEVGVVLVALNPDPLWSKRTQKFSILESEDGTNFTEAAGSDEYTFDPDTGNYVTIPLSKVKKVKAVKLMFTANSGSAGAQMAELELYAKNS